MTRCVGVEWAEGEGNDAHTEVSNAHAEVPGANRLAAEATAVRGAVERGGGEVLWPASVESMVEHIEDKNPAIVHIAGHNQYRGGCHRLVGFDAGDDDDGLSEVESVSYTHLTLPTILRV